MGRPQNTVGRMLTHDVEVTPTCWVWHGPKTRNGYGKATVLKKFLLAHRVFYEHFKGEIHEGYQVIHVCKNKLCVNPAHLKALSPVEAILFGGSPSAINARKTHCIRGHALAGANLYTTPSGRRQCVTCRALATARSLGKKKESCIA